jgi:hypothetical protein
LHCRYYLQPTTNQLTNQSLNKKKTKKINAHHVAYHYLLYTQRKWSMYMISFELYFKSKF